MAVIHRFRSGIPSRCAPDLRPHDQLLPATIATEEGPSCGGSNHRESHRRGGRCRSWDDWSLQTELPRLEVVIAVRLARDCVSFPRHAPTRSRRRVNFGWLLFSLFGVAVFLAARPLAIQATQHYKGPRSRSDLLRTNVLRIRLSGVATVIVGLIWTLTSNR